MRGESLLILPGVGAARAKALAAAGFFTVRDLALCLPKEYRDLTRATPIADLRAGEAALVRGTILETARVRWAKRLSVTRCVVSDGTASIRCAWFNQPWMAQGMAAGWEVALYGKIEREGGALVLMNPALEAREGIAPVYKAVSQVPAKVFAGLVLRAVQLLDGSWAEELPAAVREAHALPGKNEAVREAHFPTDWASLKAARRRLAFEELFFYQVALALMRTDVRRGVSIPVDGARADAFWAHLPFSPTRAQARVLREIACDLAGERAMARLEQGDVVGGKTAVAFGAMWLATGCGWQCAMMAPTEILARQHFESAQALLAPLGIRCGLILGSMGQKAHREAHEAMRSGEWQIAFGTHALLSPGVEFARLGLAVVDEQHRFGVRQRSQLAEKGGAPNVLVMSATPIPRTLSLILYGDLDVSVLDEMPPGRMKVDTFLVDGSYRARIEAFIRKQLDAGRQAFIVCPLVEENGESDDKKAVTEYAERIRPTFAPYAVGCVHGRQKPAEKDRVMAAFAAGELHILGSTTVVEVGVDVPNASVMLIENAECFGLSQLHQLRGRVGRGRHKSYCILLSDSRSEKSLSRLKIMTETGDGFEIANADLAQRGPGDFFGARQSGELRFKCASFADMALIGETRALCDRIWDGPLAADEAYAPLRRAARERLEAEAARNTLN